MVRVNIPLIQYSLDSTALQTLYRFSTYSTLAFLSRFILSSSAFTVLFLESSLTQAIGYTMLLSRSPFFSTCHDTTSLPCRILNCPSKSYLEFGLTPLKDCIIFIYSESDLIFLCSAIYILYNYCLSLFDSINIDFIE